MPAGTCGSRALPPHWRPSRIWSGLPSPASTAALRPRRPGVVAPRAARSPPRRSYRTLTHGSNLPPPPSPPPSPPSSPPPSRLRHLKRRAKLRSVQHSKRPVRSCTPSALALRPTHPPPPCTLPSRPHPAPIPPPPRPAAPHQVYNEPRGPFAGGRTLPPPRRGPVPCANRGYPPAARQPGTSPRDYAKRRARAARATPVALAARASYSSLAARTACAALSAAVASAALTALAAPAVAAAPTARRSCHWRGAAVVQPL